MVSKSNFLKTTLYTYPFVILAIVVKIFGLSLEEVIVQLNMSFEIFADKDDYGCLFISLQSRLPLDFNSMKTIMIKSKEGDLQAREELLSILKQKE